MKEQLEGVILIRQLAEKNLKANGLTTHPFPPTLGVEGDVFSMDAGRPTEGVSIAHQPTPEAKSSFAIFPELTTEQLLQETGVNKIQNPVQLIAFVSKFQEESRQAPSKNPFKDWSTDQLKKQYLAWHVNTSRIENQQKIFGGKEAVSGNAHPYSSALIEELERRKVDIRELFLESTKRAAEFGAPIRSIGAATRNLTDYEDPILQNIIRENNVEVDRIQRAQGRIGQEVVLDPEFIRTQTQRVRDLLDQGRVDANEANRLLGDLNSFMAEYMAAARAEAGERSSYFTPEQLRNIRDRENEVERNRIFEDIFAGVDASPGIMFDRAFGFHEQGKWGEFITNVKNLNDEKLTREFSARKETRAILHDANWGVSGGGNIDTFARVAETYKDEYTDLIFQDPLVETALHFFEQGFQQIRADNNGQLPYEKLEWNFKRKRKVTDPDTGEEKEVDNPGSDLEDMVWEEMRKALEKGIVKERDGREIKYKEKSDKDGLEWRLRRAIVFARGFGVLSLRFPEIAAEARLPEETVLTGADVHAQRYASIYGESIARYLDPMEHLIEKFGIGLEDRALLYYFLTGDKKKFQSIHQLKNALDIKKSQFTPGDKRLIDQINLFRTGGLFSRSSWRPRVSFVKFQGETDEDFEKRLRRSGIGVLESKVEGDVDDLIKQEVRRDPKLKFANKSDAELILSKNLNEELERAVTWRKDQVMPGEEKMTYREYLFLEKRLAMWKDALRSNPLRVMWEWEKKEGENKNPGQRMRFLREAFQRKEPDISDKDAIKAEKQLLDDVERDLMLVQEDVVSSRKPIPANENEEMLNFDLITDETQRRYVRLYVGKIREKAREDNYKFFRTELLTHSRDTDSPFPFVVGFEDIPFREYDFIKSGGRGMSRKIQDFVSAARASTELINLITGFGTAQSIEPLIGELVKIKAAIAQVDATLAMEVVHPIAEGIIRMYDKDFVARLPFGIGSAMGLAGDTSFVQKYKGRGAMSWDESDKYNFTKQLLQNGLILKKDLEALRWRVGGTVFHAGLDFVRTYFQLWLLLMALEFTQRTAKGK